MSPRECVNSIKKCCWTCHYCRGNLATITPPSPFTCQHNFSKHSLPHPHTYTSHSFFIAMSDKVREFVEIPQQFVRDGNQVRTLAPPTHRVLTYSSFQFLTRCTKPSQKGTSQCNLHGNSRSTHSTEFTQICKAVAVGFAVMGFIGYFVKLIHIPMWVVSYSLSYFDWPWW